jgi:hypothetical protein
MKRVFMACLPERFALFVRREPWAAPDWCGFSFGAAVPAAVNFVMLTRR